MPTVSVIVPTFERQARLFRLLEALAAQSHPLADIEVIVVDDGSTDGTREGLRAAAFPFELRSLSQAHAGPAAARNLGVAAARGDVVLFFDDDVVPAHDAVATHVAAHRAAPNAVVIGPMLPPEGWRRPAWIRWEEQKLLAQYDAMRRGLYPCTPRQLFTANASLPRERFIATGGFDVTFVRAEDVELGYRLKAMGLAFVFEPAARVWHYPGRSFASWRTVPYRYGQADVAMSRDKGHPALEYALEEFDARHRLSRIVARLCAGQPIRTGVVLRALGGAVHVFGSLGLHGLAGAALSVMFNVLYWQGVSDSVGGPAALWGALAARRSSVARPEPPRQGAPG